MAAPARPSTAIVSRSWQAHGATVLHRFGPAETPDAVVKLGGGAAEEARALDLLGAEARSAEVEVPAVLATGTRAGLPLIVETPVAGSPASGPVRFNFDWSFDYYPRAYERPGPAVLVYRLQGGACAHDSAVGSATRQ